MALGVCKRVLGNEADAEAVLGPRTQKGRFTLGTKRGTKRDGLRLWYAISGLEKNSVGGWEASTRAGRFPAQPLTAGSAPAALARNRLAAWPSPCGERFAALQRIRTVMKQELTGKTETPRVDKSVQTRRSSRLAPGLG